MHTGRWLVHGLLALCTACSTGRFAGVKREATNSRRPATLQVPYVSQSLLLCGGAAIAMIERWWGRRGVHAEDFAGLVRRDEGGIRTTDMATAMAARAWSVRASAATAEQLQQSLADSMPVIALIRMSTNRYHYVVLLGMSNGRITFHDPAVAPYVTVDTAEFMRRWRGANRWALFARPAPTAPNASTISEPSTSSTPTPPPQRTTQTTLDSLPCTPWLDMAADAASAQRLNAADSLLQLAATHCPAEPLLLRELAGIRFRQGRTIETVQLAQAYVLRAPHDTLGWQLLASSRYLARDARGALQAWNSIGLPALDLVRIDGSSHTRFRVLHDAMSLRTGRELTPDRLALSRRRLSDIPSLAMSRVEYTAVEGAAVEVRATVLEHPVVTPLPQLLVGAALDAGIRRDASLSVHSPLGRGERWTAQWRWQNADPRVVLSLAIPARLGVPVIVRLQRSWETYRFAGREIDERRDASAINIAGWAHQGIEVLAGARIETWANRGNFIALSSGVGLHDERDRMALLAEVEHAAPLHASAAYDRLRIRTALTPPPDRWRTIWSFRLGADWTGAATPIGLQPIAGGDLARDIPLRAHPFIVSGVLPTARTARTVVHGGAAGDRDVLTRGPVTIGAGVFLDAARIMSSANVAMRAQTYVDGGAGLRIKVAGLTWAALRVDVARGLATDRRWGINAGLAPAWPIRLGRSRDGR